MKPIRVFILGISLLGAIIAMTAWSNVHNKTTRENAPLPASSKGFAVVELFTSEGCSSCPPADALLEKIRQDNKDKPVFIVAYHVDYWDHQGWRDRFSDRAFSNRQRQYASWLNLETVYTPQVVVNGVSEYVGSDSGPILNAIAAGLKQEAATALTLNGTATGHQLTIEYKGVEAEKDAELVLALVQRSAQSSVKAGENSGRNLSHVQIVRSLQQVSLNNKKAVTMDLPNDFNTKEWELIGFVQHKTDGHITAAARLGF